MSVQDFVLSVVIGVLSGLVTSALWLITLYQFRPKIDISKHIRKAPRDGTYQIKVINRRRRAALNVKAQLHLMTPMTTGTEEFNKADPIKLRRSELLQLSGRNPQKAGAPVFRFVIDKDENLEARLRSNPQSYLAFRLFATHNVTQFGELFKQDYYQGDIIEGNYAAVDSLTIIQGTTQEDP